MKFVRRGNIYC